MSIQVHVFDGYLCTTTAVLISLAHKPQIFAIVPL